MIDNDIFTVHSNHVGDKGVERRGVGRFMTKDGHLHILEDWHGILDGLLPQGPMDARTAARVHNLPRSSYLSVQSLRNTPPKPKLPHPSSGGGSIAASAPMPAPQHAAQPDSVFEYHRAGMDRPHIVEFSGGKALLDGNPLETPELQVMLDNHRKGAATIRYRSSAGTAIAKMEQVFQDLRKAGPEEEAEMDPAEAFQHLARMSKEGSLPPGVERALRRAVYEDSMTHGVGNKYAYNEFAAKKKPGVYVGMDGNDFRAINELHGHAAGDAAIKAFGQAAREAMDEVVGQHQSKLFRTPDTQDLYRPGGDEFTAHVPTHEHAAAFARRLREKLEALPPINGVHKLSMSFGFGHNPETADKALYEAKKQKLHPGGERKYPAGSTPSFAHSLVPGSEGPVPLSGEQVPMIPPAQPASPPKAATPAPATPAPAAQPQLPKAS